MNKQLAKNINLMVDAENQLRNFSKNSKATLTIYLPKKEIWDLYNQCGTPRGNLYTPFQSGPTQNFMFFEYQIIGRPELKLIIRTEKISHKL